MSEKAPPPGAPGDPPPSPGDAGARLLVAACLILCAALKLLLDLRGPRPDSDGYLYMDVASHVRDGHGLVTSVSSFHAGFPSFPHGTNLYPLWPLVYGHAARWMALGDAGIWVPSAFYLLALALAYPLANRLWPAPLHPSAPWLRAGHLAVLVLGTARHFFWFTSLPYTEGLAYALLLLTLLRALAYSDHPSARRASEIGLLLGLTFLSRSQLVIAALAWFGALALGLAGPRRRATLAHLALSAAAFAAVVAPWFVYLRSFIPHLTPADVLAFHAYQATDALPPIEAMVRAEGPWDALLDRLSGIPVAFRGPGPNSWWGVAGPLHFAVPLALALAVARLARLDRAAALERARGWIAPEARGRLTALLFAVGGALSLHAVHKSFAGEWNFGLRHGLAALPLFFACALYLWGGTWPARLASAALLAGALWVGGDKTSGMALGAPYAEGPRLRHVVAWLEAARDAHPEGLVVASSRARLLARWVEGVGYHGIYRVTTAEDLEVMCGRLGAQYLIIRFDKGSAYAAEADRVRAHFTVVADDLDGFTVFAPNAAAGIP